MTERTKNYYLQTGAVGGTKQHVEHENAMKDNTANINAAGANTEEMVRVLPPRFRDRKFLRYNEGQAVYGFGQTKFEQLADMAGAVYKVDGVCLVKIDIFDRFLESYRLKD